MSLFGVVLDACVIYPMYLRDTLLRAAEMGFYRVHWSADILNEVRRNLVKDGRATEEGTKNLISMLQSSFPEAEVTNYEHLVESMLNDPKDRHVTAAAVLCGAQVIVTDNLNDFRTEALTPFNLEAQSADTFLTNLFYLAPDLMADIIVRQADDYYVRPMTVSELLDRLSKHVPMFAQLVRTQFANRP